MRDNYNEKFRQNCRLRLTRGSMNSGGNSNMSKIEENINPYLKEDVSQSPTKEDISYLYDWLELDKEKYLKLWDEKNGHAYIVFGANFQRFLDEDDPNSIFQWLKDHNFKYNITIGDYTYKTVGKFDGVSMRTIGKGYDRTLKNRVKLDIYWDTQKGDKLNNSLEEDEQPKYPKVDISHLHDSEIKKLVRSSYKASQKERQDFNFATSIDKEATLVKEVERAVLLQLTYYTWNTERTGKVKKSILAWFPKSALLNSLTPHSKARVVENIGQLIKSNSKGIRESVAGSESEYFTKEEIKTLPNELAKFFQEQKTPKYYDISVEDMGDKKYVLRGNIDYGEINHDHRYFDTKAKEFFDDKGIQVDIYEPDDLKGTIDEDGIYSSGHIIQKQGNMVYKPQDNELDNFLDDERE